MPEPGQEQRKTRQEQRIYNMLAGGPYNHLLVDARTREDGALGLILEEFVPGIRNAITYDIERIIASDMHGFVEACCVPPKRACHDYSW